MITKRIALAAAALTAGGCSSLGGQLTDVVFVPYANSAKTSDETLALDLVFDDEPTRTHESLGLPAAGAAAVAGAVISQIDATLKAEAERYQASYAAESSSDQFYYVAVKGKPFAGGATRVKFAGARLIRTIPGKKGGAPELAMSACFVALPTSTDAFFHLVPVSYSLRRSKAKIVAFDLTSPFGVDILNPWEILTDPIMNGGYDLPPTDNTLDVSISARLANPHYDKEGKLGLGVSKTEEPFTLKAARVGDNSAGLFAGFKTLQSKKPELASLDATCGAGEATTGQIRKLRAALMGLKLDDIDRIAFASSGRIFPSPKRAIATEDGAVGNGVFTLKIAVDEVDDYGARIKEVHGAFSKEKDGLQEQLTDFLDGNK